MHFLKHFVTIRHTTVCIPCWTWLRKIDQNITRILGTSFWKARIFKDFNYNNIKHNMINNINNLLLKFFYYFQIKERRGWYYNWYLNFVYLYLYLSFRITILFVFYLLLFLNKKRYLHKNEESARKAIKRSREESFGENEIKRNRLECWSQQTVLDDLARFQNDIKKYIFCPHFWYLFYLSLINLLHL